MVQPIGHVEALHPPGQDEEPVQLLLRHGLPGGDQQVPGGLEDRRGVDLPAEVQVQRHAVPRLRQADPLLRHPVLLRAHVGGGGAQDHLPHQLRVLDGNDLGHHPSLGGPEETDRPEAQGLHGRRRVPGHVLHRVDRGELGPPVKDVDGKFLRQAGIGRRHRLRRVHDALDAQAGEDDQLPVPFPEAEILHGEAPGLHPVPYHIHHGSPFPEKTGEAAGASPVKRFQVG